MSLASMGVDRLQRPGEVFACPRVRNTEDEKKEGPEKDLQVEAPAGLGGVIAGVGASFVVKEATSRFGVGQRDEAQRRGQPKPFEIVAQPARLPRTQRAISNPGEISTKN